VYLSAGAATLVPLGVVTRTSTVPLPAGAVAVTWVSLTTVKLEAALLPKDTPVAPVRCTPVIVTVLPPPIGPAEGLSAVTAGWAGISLSALFPVSTTKILSSESSATPPGELKCVLSITAAVV
jgi:hypothetical protein